EEICILRPRFQGAEIDRDAWSYSINGPGRSKFSLAPPPPRLPRFIAKQEEDSLFGFGFPLVMALQIQPHLRSSGEIRYSIHTPRPKCVSIRRIDPHRRLVPLQCLELSVRQIFASGCVVLQHAACNATPSNHPKNVLVRVDQNWIGSSSKSRDRRRH